MKTPSKIVKSAHHRAGRPKPLKSFAQDTVLALTSRSLPTISEARLLSACKAWLKLKGLAVPGGPE